MHSVNKNGLAEVCVVRQTEVGDFPIEVVVQEQILGFQVPMHHHVSVAVIDAADHLLEEPSRLVLFQLKRR